MGQFDRRNYHTNHSVELSNSIDRTSINTKFEIQVIEYQIYLLEYQVADGILIVLRYTDTCKDLRISWAFLP